MSSRPFRMVAVLLVREYIGKHLCAAWIVALVPDYAPRSWRIKCTQVTLGEKVKSNTNRLQKTEILLPKLTKNCSSSESTHKDPWRTPSAIYPSCVRRNSVDHMIAMKVLFGLLKNMEEPL